MNQLALDLGSTPVDEYQYELDDIVITPDYGSGRVIERSKPGELSFANMCFDDGTQPTEPVIAVRTAQHRWRWYLQSELQSPRKEKHE